MKKLLIVFIMACIGTVNAQVLNFSGSTEKFLDEVSKQFTKNGIVNPTAFTQFSSVFNSLDAASQKQTIELVQAISKKGYKPNDVLLFMQCLSLYSAKAAGKTLSPTQFLSAIYRTIDPQGAKNGAETLKSIYIFLDKKHLYSSSFNKLIVNEGDFDFMFNDVKKDLFSSTVQKTEIKVEQDFGWGDSQKEEEYDPWNDPSLNVKPGQISELNAPKDLVNIPKVQGLLCVFKDLNLAITSPSDSFVVQHTSGAYEFGNSVLVGHHGTLQWEASKAKVTAFFDKYTLKAIGNNIKADHVKILHEGFLKDTVEGVLELRLEKRNKDTRSTYPRFKSYLNTAKLELNKETIEYKGGYSLIGNTIESGSMYEPFSKLIGNKTSINTFTVIGRKFTFTDSTIISPRVSFITKIGKDSVDHPAVKMHYDLQKKTVRLNKLEKSGFKNSMYSDSFHQVDIKSDAMLWDLETGNMDFYIVSGKSEVPAIFESFNYYNPDRLRTLSTAAGFNPLLAAGNLVAKKKKNTISLAEMQAVVNKEPFQVSNGMQIGHMMGFFNYDPYTNLYSLSRKGEHYFLSLLGKTDFDDLVLSSLTNDKTGKNNASINLKDKSLDIKGAQDFKLSDSLGISFEPTDQSMKIIGNKIFSFNGRIGIKNFKFYGDFEVEYEKFLVKLKRIDSITFVPLAAFKKGSRQYIGGHYQYGKTGIIYLNSPDNKSGRRKLLEYPKLEIPAGVLVYFNEAGRKQKFSDDIVFKSTAIVLDSLNTSDLAFEGEFKFGKIMKPIKDKLVVMPDSSMGMRHRPKGPLALYNTASTLKPDADISLNRDGLKSAGELKHLSALLQTSSITLFEDHLIANGQTGKIVETLSPKYFPAVNISDYASYWEPSLDSMAISSAKGFVFYNNTSKLIGSLNINKKGLFGQGEMLRDDIDIKSEKYQFQEAGFLASLSSFALKTEDKTAKPVFSGEFIGIDFNVKKAQVNFKSGDTDIEKNPYLAFPYSSYSTTIDNALWDIKSKKISMKGELASSLFSSTLASQFGLKYYGTKALYDIAGRKLNIGGVKEIFSADAAIIPPKGDVFIDPQGLVEPFVNARIIADTLTRYHSLTKANVKINSKISFTGNAQYQFVNVSADTFNIQLANFEFADILEDGTIASSKSSNKLNTIAKAKIAEKDSLYLSPRMLYKGEMTMLSPFKNLALDGLVKPDLKNYPMFGGSWISYRGNKSEAISINVDESLKDGGKPLYVGLHMSEANTAAMYPTFLSMKRSGDDNDVFTTKGLFKRDEENKRFRVSTGDETQIGNTYDFYDQKGIIELDGKFNLLGAPTKVMDVAGQARLKVDSAKYTFSTMMKIEFPMSIPLTQKLGQNLVKANLDAGNSNPALLVEEEAFLAKLSQYVGKKDALEYQNKYRKEPLPLFKFSQQFLNSMLISDLDLRWVPAANAYVSTSSIGISNMGDVDINAQVNGYVEIAKSTQTGNEINIYIEPSIDKWYFFKYSNGQLSLTSSDQEVNKMLNTNVDGKKQGSVVFMDTDMAVRFKKRFELTYLGKKEVVAKPNSPKPITPTTTKKPVKKEEEKEGF